MISDIQADLLNLLIRRYLNRPSPYASEGGALGENIG
jgi:hypothetical protein